MKMQRPIGAFCAAVVLALASLPARAAEQASFQAPTAGPMSMATFVGTYLNPGLRALGSCSWGSSAPVNGPSGAPIAYQCWADTTTNPVVFKHFDGTSWVPFGSLNTSTHVWTPVFQGSDAGTASIAATGTSGHTLGFLDGANTWSGVQSFNSGMLGLKGSGSGLGTLNAPAAASSYVWTLPAATGTLVDQALAQTLTNKSLTAPTITGGTAVALTGFGIRSTGASFDIRFAATETLSADRTITYVVGDASRTITLGGNVTTAGAFAMSGAFGFTGTLTGTTAVTFPTVGTLATLAGAETLTNKTFVCANQTSCVVRLASDVTGTLQATNFPALTGDVTTSAGSLATTLANIPTGVPAAGTIVHSNIAAPSSPAAGKVSIWTDATDLRFHDKNASGVIGTTVVADTGSANNFLTAISAAGAISKARPACANLSDSSVFCSGTDAANLTGTVASARMTGSYTGITGVGTLTAGALGSGFTTVAITQGGSGQTTAAAARASSGFNIDQATSTGDANYTILSTDRMVYHTALTAARTDTLPPANSVNPGQVFVVNDIRGVASGSNTITLQRAGSDTINGVASVVAINAQYGAGIFWSDGSSRWTFFPAAAGGGGGTVTSVAPGAGLQSGGTLTAITNSGTLSIDGSFGFRNRLINPSGEIWQRANSSGGAIADGSYAFDRWYGLSQTAGNSASQQTNVENGMPYMMRLAQANASAQRFGIAQVIESKNSIDLRGQGVVLSARVRMSASTTLRYAIIEWTGTADTVTKDFVLDWTNGTFTAGNFFTTTSTTITATGSTALTANTLATVSLSGTIGSSANNVAVIFWTDSTQAQNVTLDIGKAQLEVGLAPTALAKRSIYEETALCQRYYYRRNSSAVNEVVAMMQSYSSTGFFGLILALPVTMLKIPTAAISNVSHFSINNPSSTTAAVSTLSIASNSVNSLGTQGATSSGASLNTGGAAVLQFNTTSGWIEADAEI